MKRSDISEIRRENLRLQIERHGATKLASMLGYRQPSFLTQMAGPNPSRDITEKTARRFEQDLNLELGALDLPLGSDMSGPQAATLAQSAEMVTDVVRLVGAICEAEGVELSMMKFADVVALAYVDTAEHGAARPDRIKQIVRLLK
jgi:hypothetical protein